MNRLFVIFLIAAGLVLMALLSGWWLVPVLTLLVGDSILVGLVGLVNRLVQLLLLGVAAFFVASWWPELRQELSVWQKSLSGTPQGNDVIDDDRFLLENQQLNLEKRQVEHSTDQADRIDDASEDKILSHQPQASSFRFGSITLPSYFTGRQMELQELFHRVTQEGVRVVALQADEAAVGKTVLAMKLGEHLSPHYPEGHIFVDMQGSSDEPLSPQQAMRIAIRSYQPKANLPQDEAELKSFYHSMLTKQSLLFLLDDVANPEQLEPLLPTSDEDEEDKEAAGKAVLLITSRQYFVLPNMAVKRLGKLFADDARTLLLQLAPRIGEEASELATLCSLHPLALRLAASMLAQRGDLIPAQYIWQLRDPQRPFSKLSGLEKVFSLNYELMEEAEQRQWRMLALFSASFDQAAAAALWELEADAAQEMLERLVGESVVELFSPPSFPMGLAHSQKGLDSRYELQKVMREFAESRLLENERVTGQRRLAIHFETVLREANELYQQSSTQSKGLALFKREWQNMQAGQAWAAGLVAQDKIATALSIAYPEVGLSLLIQQQPTKQIDWLKTAITATRHLKHRDAECRYLGYLGQVHAELGQVRRAIGYYEQQLMISRELSVRLLEADALANLGSGYMSLNNMRQAITYYEQQLMVTRNIVDSPEVREREAKTLGSLGQAYQEMGQLDHAMSCYEQQLNIAHEFSDKPTESRALAFLGDVYTELGDFSNALVCYGQHLTLERDLDNQVEQSQALGKLGNAYADMGDIERALEYYEQQLIISREIANRELEGKALGNLGIAYAELGKTRHSIDYCTQALEIDRELGNKEGEAIGAWNLALIYYHLHKFDLAVPLMQITVDYERATGHPEAETHAHYLEIVRDQVRGG